MRVGIMAVVLVLVALQDTPAKTRFVLPKRAYILTAAPWVEFYVQVFVARHADNRRYRLTWDGESCGGGAGGDLEGEDAPAIQPTAPLKVRAGNGVCTFELRVYAGGEKVREFVPLDVKVCGATTEDQGPCS